MESQPKPDCRPIHVYWSRHGETLWNTQNRMQGLGDSPLTEKGLADARRLADALADVPLGKAFCSPAPRARRTCDLALAGRRIPIIEDDRIQEMALGRFEGLTVEEAYFLDAGNTDAFFHKPDRYVPFGGESFADVYERIRQFLDDLTSPCPGDQNRFEHDYHVLVISHNITIKTALTIMRGLPVEKLREGPSIPQATLIQAVYRPDRAVWTFPDMLK